MILALEEQAFMKTLRERFRFDVAVTVETGKGVNFDDACRWLFAAAEDGKYLHLRGRVQPRPLFPESVHVLWDFEYDDDAILFTLRFRGTFHRMVDVDAWRRELLAQITSR